MIVDEGDNNERCERVFEIIFKDTKCEINGWVMEENCIFVSNDCKFDKCSSYGSE
jgi:hypothetical protein